jgi:hypothetical protein
MKFLWLLIFCLSTVSIVAQDNNMQNQSSTKEAIIKEEQRKVNNLIKNPGAEDFNLNGYIIDKRAVQYYHPGNLNEISLEKARKINFLYLHAYQINNEHALSEECVHYMKTAFDTGPYNHLRKWNEAVQTEIRWKECVIHITLMSWIQIDQQFSAQ